MELRSRYAMTVCSGKELKVKKHLMMLKQRHERKNISVGVENFLYRKRGFYWRRNSFVIMILLAKVSHIEKMMVQVQCGQVSRMSPVRIFLICLSMKVYLTDEFSLINISKNNDLAWDMIHIGQADVNIMECGKVKEVYVY